MRNETKLLYKTNGGGQPAGKPRVYFTCHPADAETFFEKVCGDLFVAHDCAVYYTEDMAGALPEDTRETDLDRMNLFVIPVTTRLLVEENRAMDEDFAFARERHIPVLPLMMQPGLDPIYSRKDRFGELQYLDPFSTDETAVTYEEKLKKYLEAVLVSDETVRRIRAAFDAYIFLSYRKKDRAFANTLMRLIHSHPLCRDIAVWYDEFLTPGESFNENIERALKDSRLFALLVTPNLLEEPDGKPNFVMGTEYPAARDAGMDIFPAEMAATDRAALAEKFAGLPQTVDASDEAAFTKALAAAVSEFAKAENDDDPAHNYLIGLAYLDGVDVETDRERALALITSAAEADLPEAMKKLIDMYSNGRGVALNYESAVRWARKHADFCARTYGEEAEETLVSQNDLSVALLNNGAFAEALQILEELYPVSCRVRGEEHRDTLVTMGNLALLYGKVGDYKRQVELQEKCYALKCRVFGEEHPSTLVTFSNVAVAYLNLGNYEKALELNEKCYLLKCRVLGEEHPDTLLSLSDLAGTYGRLGDYKRQAELQEKCYALKCRVLGEDHPDTLLSLSDLALSYRNLGEFKKAQELYEKCYAAQCRVLGEEHPNTLATIANLAFTYSKLFKLKEEFKLGKKSYVLYRRVLGEEHPDTLNAMTTLALTYGRLGKHKKEAELAEQCYTLKCRLFGEEHPETLIALNNLALANYHLGDYQKALALFDKCYALKCRVLGEEHPDTLTVLFNLAVVYGKRGNDKKKAAELLEICYEQRCRVLGEKHPDTLAAQFYLIGRYFTLFRIKKMLRLIIKMLRL